MCFHHLDLKEDLFLYRCITTNTYVDDVGFVTRHVGRMRELEAEGTQHVGRRSVFRGKGVRN